MSPRSSSAVHSPGADTSRNLVGSGLGGSGSGSGSGSGFGPVYLPDDVMRLRGSFYSDGLVEGYLRSNPYHYVPTGGGAVSSVDLRESAVTDVGVAAVARHVGEALRSIDVSCTTVGDEGLKALAESCPNLAVVRLNATRVTDTGVKELAKRAGESLRRVDVSARRLNAVAFPAT